MNVPIVRKMFFSHHAFVERRLHGPGEITVKVGDTLRPFDVIGEAQIEQKQETYPLAKFLGVRVKKMPKCLLKGEGQSFQRGEMIAAARTFFGLRNRRFSVDYPGLVEKVNLEKGELTLQSQNQRYKLTAGVPGKVNRVIPKLAVLLETSAHVLRGVWAAGDSVEGEITVIGTPDKPAHLELIRPDLAGKIVVAGSFVSGESLAKAAALGVKGIVCGGTNFPRDKSYFLNLGLSILVTEGFGEVPFDPAGWQFLQSVVSRHTLLIPARQELLVPAIGGEVQPSPSEMVELFAEIKIGDRVEIFSWPYFARIGKVLRFSSAPVVFPSEVTADAVCVKLEGSGEEVEIPVRNVGIIS